MNGLKHIVFRLLFLITLLFCLGLEASSYYNSPLFNVEFSSHQNSEDTNIFSEDDSSEDDHINLDVRPCYFARQLIFHSISKHSPSPKEHIVSSWKPPKYS